MLKLLHPLFPPAVFDLYQFILESIYFLYNREYYEKTEGVAMGSLLSPMIANFYMECFEHHVLDSELL